MLQKKDSHIPLIILIALILGGIFYWGRPYLNKTHKMDTAPQNNQTPLPQNSETSTQTDIMDGEKIVVAEKNATDNQIHDDGNKTLDNKILNGENSVPADKIITTEKGIKPHKNNTDNDDRGSKTNEIAMGKIIVLPDIDYKNLKEDEQLKQLMVSRKEELGIDKSLDMIVNSNESFRIGDVKIPLRDILEKATIKQGKVFEEKIEDSGAVKPEIIKKFGIYVVQPGDNIWNIHFNILKEYYSHQKIELSPLADEPVSQGASSGIGKILKFSETMVIIYNFIEQKIDTNIDLLEPLSKIIIYNMEEIFSLLQEVNYENIDRIQFDGKTIWVPAKKI